MKTSQKQRIINYIREFGSISTREAFIDLGIARLGARIFELKQDGYKFKEEWESTKNRYGEKTEYKRFYLEDDMASENMNHIPII
jgi:hypothetical protein